MTVLWCSLWRQAVIHILFMLPCCRLILLWLGGGGGGTNPLNPPAPIAARRESSRETIFFLCARKARSHRCGSHNSHKSLLSDNLIVHMWSCYLKNKIVYYLRVLTSCEIFHSETLKSIQTSNRLCLHKLVTDTYFKNNGFTFLWRHQ